MNVSLKFFLIIFIIIFQVITCAEITVVFTYFQLCSEDYNWWWRSFLTAASSGLYLFLYSIYYAAVKLELELFVSMLLYYGYMLLASIAFALVTGTIGFFACFIFVRKIYASIKID